MADSRDNLKSHITLTKPKWKSTTTGHPTAYGYEGPNGRKDFMEEICLGQLNYSPAHHTQRFWIYNKTLSNQDPEISKKWIRWLLSPEESPWREIVKAQEPVDDFDWVFDNAYILTNLDFASNWLVNFLTAWRLSLEKYNLVVLWDKLVEAGASKGSAYLATFFVNTGYSLNPNAVQLNPSPQGHFAVSCNVSADLSTAYRLNNGVPFRSEFLKNKFKDDTRNLPCNVVWMGVGENTYDYRDPSPLPKLFWNMVETGKPEGVCSTIKRMFVNPIRSYSEPDVKRPTTTTFETLLKFCLYLDSLKPGEDFPLNDC